MRATQKFGEHEQASTRLNFASKSSKGKILRAVKNFNGPLITPKNTRVHRLWDTPRQRTFLKILDIKPGQTSSDGSDPKELLSVDHPCYLKHRNAPKYILMTT